MKRVLLPGKPKSRRQESSCDRVSLFSGKKITSGFIHTDKYGDQTPFFGQKSLMQQSAQRGFRAVHTYRP